MEPKARNLILDVDKTLDHYFNTLHGKPLRRKTVHELAEDYLDRKLDNPGFDPPEKDAYLIKKLREIDLLHAKEYKRNRVLPRGYNKILMDGIPIPTTPPVNGQTYNSPILQWLGDRKLRDLDKKDLRIVINSLGPDEDMKMGKKFLLLLLDAENTKEVLLFCKRAAVLLGAEGKYLKYDFGKKRTDLINKLKVNLLDRRTFLQTIGWAYPGFIELVLGTLATLDGVSGLLGYESEKEDHSHKKRTIFRTASDEITAAELIVAPPTAVIGAALIQEGYDKWKEIKLSHIEHIANAVGEMRDLMELSCPPIIGPDLAS